jgi:CheY-like chemotaxis protein
VATSEGGEQIRSPDSRSSLVRELAHELRDALSPIASTVDLLRLRNFDPDVSRTLAEKVDRGLRRAFAIIDAFVLAEQCENGTLVLETLPCSLNHILEAARERLAPELRERCIFIPAPASAMVKADAARTADVLSALLQHAGAIALPATAIEVRASAAQAQTPAQVRIRSRIDARLSPEEEWFLTYRACSDGRMPLRTARRIMVLQHGALEAAAHVPGECELVATLARDTAADTAARAGAAQPSTAPRSSEGAVAGKRIIIVDDSGEVRRAYRQALLALGYTVTEAADADQALGALDRDRPDVALIDIHLPRINGYRLAQAMRARAGSAIRLVMLSGMTLDPTTQRLSREAGFDDCVDKMAGPLALHALLQAAE